MSEADLENTVVRIEAAPDDPICARLSIGGVLGNALYCTYRYGPRGGTPGELCEILRVVSRVLERAEAARAKE